MGAEIVRLSMRGGRFFFLYSRIVSHGKEKDRLGVVDFFWFPARSDKSVLDRFRPYMLAGSCMGVVGGWRAVLL